ncbi:hypothetical protein [Pseudofrankia sp. BMG5.36]|uniref:hypothetical protein n=1 Tax=Pseudofrankia sp. BMG5.36 TaxID=1834512 RepID=UPI0018E37CE7|nr:hypothetical protein [Pseudofrankia sp. BMG5.36]
MPYQPPAGPPHPLPIRAQRRRGDVLVVVNRDGHVVERVGKFAWYCARLAEVRLEDGGDISPVDPSILRFPR